MNLPQIAKSRTISQQISGPRLETGNNAVAWMVALQAQDYEMAKWGIGVRTRKATQRSVQAAIDSGRILRTHVLRPTWHFVSAQDIRWLLDLTAPHILASLRARHKELELTESAVRKSNEVIAKALASAKSLSREELIAELKGGGLPTRDNRASHFLLLAELAQLICSGPSKAGKPTYALFDERVPETRPLTQDESLARLAERYFTSRCPATFQDFTWWSGLRIKDARKGLDLVKPSFHEEKFGSQIYWVPNSFGKPEVNAESVHLLPAFDEMLISYRNRNASLARNDRVKTIANNGLFRPAVAVNGQVIGKWRRTIEENGVHVEFDFWKKPADKLRHSIEKASQRYGDFLEKTIRTIL